MMKKNVEVLAQIDKKELSLGVRMFLAEKCDDKLVLEALSNDEALYEELAENDNTPSGALEKIFAKKSYSEYEEVKFAEHPNASEAFLEELTKDIYWDRTRTTAARRIKNPDLLDKLSEDKNYQLREAVASNLYTPEDTLRRLAKDRMEVKIHVVFNEKTPYDVLLELKKDKEGFVSALATAAAVKKHAKVKK